MRAVEAVKAVGVVSAVKVVRAVSAIRSIGAVKAVRNIGVDSAVRALGAVKARELREEVLESGGASIGGFGVARRRLREEALSVVGDHGRDLLLAVLYPNDTPLERAERIRKGKFTWNTEIDIMDSSDIESFHTSGAPPSHGTRYPSGDAQAALALVTIEASLSSAIALSSSSSAQMMPNPAMALGNAGPNVESFKL
ncbi:hypothetical protein CYMTET_52314 [Cymbomonas tetramitiformis]|uniref:Uncharacterized protein n=1 Tax=Cymbomonas tetramitiformis TaxID=36881 RepID=A0AAE0BJ85_9CHLO|nr:hypothetical protein CYMTET_52314 [Cymbomonas tetramitiformis]